MARKDKLFYKIGEVCRICDIPAHVLRYWETEFSLLAPTKNRSGQRIFRERDVRIVATIKRLLYEEGYTIAGARKQLRQNGEITRDMPLFARSVRGSFKEVLKEIRIELQDLLVGLEKGIGKTKG